MAGYKWLWFQETKSRKRGKKNQKKIQTILGSIFLTERENVSVTNAMNNCKMLYVANCILATKYHTNLKEKARFKYPCSRCKGLSLQNKKVEKFRYLQQIKPWILSVTPGY